jgi:DNA-binding MarR family transcriptional regulator
MTNASLLRDSTCVHEFFWFWYEWVRSPGRRRQIEDLTGLPESAWKLLYKLQSHGRSSVTELGRLVDLDKSTVSRHLEPLRTARLVVETPGRRNRRVSEISVSQRGKDLCEMVDQVHLQYWSDVLAHLPATQRRGLARSLQALQRAMDVENAPDLVDDRDAS